MTNWPMSVRRGFIRLAEEVVELDGEQDEAPSLAAMAEDARKLLGRVAADKQKRARVRSRGEDSRKRKDAERQKRNERMVEIRHAVFARADGLCECCRTHPPVEWHHLISGALRRERESVETTAAVCAFCHVDLHRSRFAALAAMRSWALARGFREAADALDHRIAKLTEAAGAARRSQGEP